MNQTSEVTGGDSMTEPTAAAAEAEAKAGWVATGHHCIVGGVGNVVTLTPEERERNWNEFGRYGSMILECMFPAKETL
jgi:hypothetical protein